MLIISSRTEHVRIKSYDANVKGSTSVLTIKLEVTDTYELSYILRSLEELMAEKKSPPAVPLVRATVEPETRADAKPKGRGKAVAAQTMLALPAPRRSTV